MSEYRYRGVQHEGPVTDVGRDTVRELRRLNESVASIRAWVTFFGGLVVTSLVIGVIAAVFVAAALIRS